MKCLVNDDWKKFGELDQRVIAAGRGNHDWPLRPLTDDNHSPPTVPAVGRVTEAYVLHRGCEAMNDHRCS